MSKASQITRRVVSVRVDPVTFQRIHVLECGHEVPELKHRLASGYSPPAHRRCPICEAEAAAKGTEGGING